MLRGYVVLTLAVLFLVCWVIYKCCTVPKKKMETTQTTRPSVATTTGERTPLTQFTPLGSYIFLHRPEPPITRGPIGWDPFVVNQISPIENRLPMGPLHYSEVEKSGSDKNPASSKERRIERPRPVEEGQDDNSMQRTYEEKFRPRYAIESTCATLYPAEGALNTPYPVEERYDSLKTIKGRYDLPYPVEENSAPPYPTEKTSGPSYPAEDIPPQFSVTESARIPSELNPEEELRKPEQDINRRHNPFYSGEESFPHLLDRLQSEKPDSINETKKAMPERFESQATTYAVIGFKTPEQLDELKRVDK